MALLSIVIPTYNHAHFLAEAIQSALSQQGAETDVVVVDDGSTDEPESVVRGFGRQVRYVSQRRGGLPIARNQGLAHCRSEYVTFLDADDRLLPNAALEGIDRLIGRTDWAFVSGQHRYIDRAGDITAEWGGHPPDSNHFEHLLRNNYIGMVATVVFRRAALLAVGGFDASLAACEDYDLYLRIARAHAVGAHAEVVAEYRRYGEGMSDDPARMLRAALGVLSRQCAVAARDPAFSAAHAAGLAHWRAYYGSKLALRAHQHFANGRWRQGVRDAATLARHAGEYVPRIWSGRTD